DRLGQGVKDSTHAFDQLPAFLLASRSSFRPPLGKAFLVAALDSLFITFGTAFLLAFGEPFRLALCESFVVGGLLNRLQLSDGRTGLCRRRCLPEVGQLPAGDNAAFLAADDLGG